MWEITLCGTYDDLVQFVEMEKVLKDKFDKDIITVIWINDKVVCNLATTKKEAIEFIKKIVVVTILKIAKTAYFRENLKVYTNDISLNSFLLSSLVMLDLEYEIDFVYEHYKLSQYIDINSFIHFRLCELTNIWDNTIKYLNDEFLNCDSDNIYLEFLKLLTELQTPMYDVLYIEKNSECVELYDFKHSKIKEFPSTDEVGVLVNLIMFSPKKIIVNCINGLSEKISSLISYIFEEKLSFLL